MNRLDPEMQALVSLAREARESWVAQRATEIATDPLRFDIAVGGASAPIISRVSEVVRQLGRPGADINALMQEAAILVSAISIREADEEYDILWHKELEIEP